MRVRSPLAAVAVAAALASGARAVEAGLAERSEAFLREQWAARGGAAPSDGEIADTVRRAIAARQRASWGSAVPEELFLRYVLPEVALSEPPTPWREELAARLASVVAGATSAGEAAVRLNDGMWKVLGVGYSDAPMRRPALPPARTIALGRSSCTSLAILLVDACRAFGVPARIAGIPAWVTPEGGATTQRGGFHQWVEVWDGTWRSLSAIDSSALDRAWLSERAAKTDASRPEHRIYAASFATTGAHFPLPWARGDRSVPGIDVTALYTHRRALRFELPAHSRLELRRGGELFAVAHGAADEVMLAEGESYDWSLAGRDGRRLAVGRLTVDAATPPRITLPQAGATAGSSASHSRTSSPPSPQLAHVAIEPRKSR